MKALVVYESMYGNTHTIAERVADGLRSHFEVTLVPVSGATAAMAADADLLVVGGPTHIHTMTSERSRQAARDAATKPGQDLVLDPAATDPGLREWLSALPDGLDTAAAAFDTRTGGPALLTGRASKRMAKLLKAHGGRLVARPMSFRVDNHNHLRQGEASRAAAWGATVAGAAGRSHDFDEIHV